MRPLAPEFTDPSTRLPMTDPGYRYPESRNPYFKKLKPLEGLVYVDNGAESHSGHWRSRFPDAMNLFDVSHAKPRPLHVEIGCNGGHVILEWAARNPSEAYVGLDWKFKQIHRGAEKALKRSIANLVFFRAHAERIRFMFGPGEIDRLYLFFPDPWPKKSQWKNRTVNPANLATLAGLVKPGGIFHIKTDHEGYFDWMEGAIAESRADWRVVESTRNLHAGHLNPQSLTFPEVTLFERLFIAKGVPIKSVKLERVSR